MEKSATIPTWERVSTALVVILPFFGFVVGIIPLWGSGADKTSLSLCVLVYVYTELSITVGFHRYFTHGSFRIVKRPLKWVLGIGGSMALEGSVFSWVGWHLKHHSSPDREGDPHSPHLHKPGFWGFLKGLVHSHVGWMFVTPTQKVRAMKRLRNDPDAELIDQWFLVFGFLGLALPVVLGAILRGSFAWAHVDFIWGGLIRVFLMHHVTWSVNSVCHIWGSQPFDTGDQSRNNPIVGFAAFGEGWHNNHHQFPSSAQHGLLPGQFDFSWSVIRIFEKFGWITEIQTPSADDIQKRLAKVAS